MLVRISLGMLFVSIILFSLTPTLANSIGQGNADVLYVRAVETEKNVWTFHVTVSHPDTGWKDYADGWDVVLPDNTVLKTNASDTFTRVLLHPHETEQPFTRSQRNLKIPADVTTVRVRAHDMIDGFGGKEVVVDFSNFETKYYKVERLGK